VSGRHRVVVIGGGFAGLRCVRALRRAPVEVTLIDRRNFHLFQPLLYQVATGGLSPGEIAVPLRGVLRRQRNARVVLGEVTDVDLAERRVRWRSPGREGLTRFELGYDTLVVAAGARHAYFGHDEWERDAPGLKTLEDALEIRRRILLAFEAAEVESDLAERDAWLTFVVVGAGPTGVELAGQVAEISRDTLRDDFRDMDPQRARILLVEGADRVLTSFVPALSARARRQLERMGVRVIEHTLVTDVRPDGVTLKGPDGVEVPLRTHTVIWAAGVAASPLAAMLGQASGAEVDRAGRVRVEDDLTLPGHPEVFVLGDMAAAHDQLGQPLPGVAPVAMQQGEHAARGIVRRVGRAGPTGAFHYRDKGNMATIGRAAAVADIHGLRMWGVPAWLAWLLVHLMFLVGFQNRLLVVTRWMFWYLTRGRGARLITGHAPTDTVPPPG
jgi:NADH dehydrogenase